LSNLAQELLINTEHLKHLIFVMVSSGTLEEKLRPYREQLHVVQSLDMELSAFCLNIEREGLRVEETIKVTERIDELVEQCKAFLRVQSRELARESLKQLRDEHRVFLHAMDVRRKARS